jgi:hypothetical protein
MWLFALQLGVNAGAAERVRRRMRAASDTMGRNLNRQRKRWMQCVVTWHCATPDLALKE